jgi:hypothetical protein
MGINEYITRDQSPFNLSCEIFFIQKGKQKLAVILKAPRPGRGAFRMTGKIKPLIDIAQSALINN